MTLSEAQQKFAKMVGQLLTWIYTRPGLGVTFGDAYRTPAQAQENAADGKGIVNSLHCQRLAVDLNLFKDGVYQSDTAAYKAMGDYWKTLDPSACWGGDFHTNPDGNHFSFTWGGYK